MKTRDTNKLIMFQAVVNHCQHPGHGDAVAKLPGFALASQRFADAVEGLEDRFSLSLQLNPSTSAESKATLLDVLATEAARLSGGVVTWAKVHGDPELAGQAHIVRSTITNAREIQAADWVEGLVNTATKAVEANPQGLADYGVTLELIDDLAIHLERFNQAIGRPRSIINARKRANRSIPVYITKADEQLGHMDRLAALLEATHPDFVVAYRDSRKVVHFAATRALTEEEKANAEVRAAREELLDAQRSSELSAILAKRDATRAQARQIRAALSA